MRRNTYLRGSRRTLIQQLAGTCSSKAPVIASETAGLPRYRCRHACLSWYTTASRKQQRLAFGTVYLPDPPARHGGMPLYPVRQETREMDARSLAQAIPRPTTVRQLTIVWSARHTNPARPSITSKFRGPVSRDPGNVRHGPRVSPSLNGRGFWKDGRRRACVGFSSRQVVHERFAHHVALSCVG